MSITPGTRLGPYEVLAQIGEGGMGEVYKATDTNLKRAVAIKVLPQSVAEDADRLARFQREAEVLAALNHPNIAAIYGLERSGPATALVMELVEGPTLADRIAQSAIPVDEALPIAKQIAEALEAAHEQGVIHRDLKPANIKVRADGTVKVLDFGLAKAMEPASRSLPSMSMSPTITTPAMTQAGLILGTAAYMSPEQASGKPVDKRSDIWSFGVVQFEMLTGRRLFDGETISHTLADVLRGPIDFSQLPADTPEVIRDLLRRCLNRDVKKRTRDIGEARIQLEDLLSGAGGTASPGPSTVAPVPSRARERLVWLSALALVALAAVAGTLAWVRARVSAVPAALETRLEIATLATADPFSFAISPDGRRVVFAASTRGGQSQLWLRPLEAVSAQLLAGTEGATYPFWSPDSRSVGFFADNSLKRIDIGGGLLRTLASPGTRGGTWSPEGVILFAPTAGPLSRVPAGGGEVVAVTKLSAGQTGHRFPQFLPGGRQFLFYANANTEDAGIYLASLDRPDAKRVTAADTAGVYAPPGWLFFMRQGTLVARRFDAVRGELTGDPVTVAEPVAIDSTVRVGAFSVSTTGLITYRAGGASPKQLTWFDRSGKSLGTLGAQDATQFDPALSPDGLRVAVSRVVQPNTDIWLIDAARTTRFTFDPGVDRYPQWSPDGSRLVFSRVRTGVLDLYQRPSNGAGAEALLLESPQPKAAYSWSQDGRSLLYGAVFPKTGFDVWVLPMAGDPKPLPFLNSTFAEGLSVYSPDGHWVAYQSNESGRIEIYVRPFPSPGGQWQVSTSGGVSPRWRRDGKELYYVAPDSTLMAVPIVVKGAAVEPGLPIALFQPRVVFGGTQPIGYEQQYDVAPDGRFLININTDEDSAAPITVIENWKPSN